MSTNGDLRRVERKLDGATGGPKRIIYAVQSYSDPDIYTINRKQVSAAEVDKLGENADVMLIRVEYVDTWPPDGPEPDIRMTWPDLD